jgi:hypothetical protein
MAVFLGRLYTTLSLSALPTALLAVVVMVAGFEEHGPQSQGLGVLVVGAAAVLLALFINAVIAALLAWRVVMVRPRATRVGAAFAVMTALVGAVLVALRLS